MSSETVLLDDDFSAFDAGPFSADVGPHTEYHFLPEAAPRHGWSVACFGSGWESGAGRAWVVAGDKGRKVMRQTHANQRRHTHPMVASGDFLWNDYTLVVRFAPGAPGTTGAQASSGASAAPAPARCGVVFRYHNNRCYTFFGFDGPNRVVLRVVSHEKDFQVPDERELGSAAFAWAPGREYAATVRLRGKRIRAEIALVAPAAYSPAAPSLSCVLEAEDATWPRGKVALLSDFPADFFSVRVTAPAAAARAVAQARSKAERELADLRAAQPKPVLWKKLKTPGFGVGRNLRFGDLNGDGKLEIVVGQMNHHGVHDDYSEVGCVTAMTFDGDVLWQSGTPDPAKYALTNDVGFQVHDIDGDGRAEVIYCRDFELVIADGRTGEVRNKVPTPESKAPATRYPHILGDCLFFCDISGKGRAADILIKDRYWHFWMLDEHLHPLWSGDCRTGHYPFAFDVDGDGRDEIAIGYSLWDHDGRMLWNLEDRVQDHADGVAIVDFREKRGSQPKVLYTASDSGFLMVSLDGRILKHHRVGHVQNPAIAKLRPKLAGLQVVSINFWGNQGIVHFWDGAGDMLGDVEPLNMGSMCLPVNWTGDGVELFCHNPNPKWGGLYDGWGRPVVQFPDDGHPDMANAVLDLTGDCRDEIVVWNPRELWVYTQDDSPKRGRLYKPTRNPLYNTSNYQATVSLPGWSE